MPEAHRKSPPGKDGGLIIALLALLFALPVAAATTLYLSGWRPAASAAHGVLVQPPLPVTHVVLGEANGKTVRLGDFRSKWTLLYFGPAECSAACRHSLAVMRQVQIAQGRERERVQRVFVEQGAMPPGWQDEVPRAFPGMTVVVPGNTYGKHLPASWAVTGRIFLIDPLGNRVMDYPATADPGGIRQDLARLLAYSWVG